MKLYLPTIMCILLAGNLFAATPANNKPAEKEQQTQQQVKPVDSSKLQKSTPAITFTPSEKVGADSAVSFPVDI
jgi:hemolysin activation/secretion protein